MNQTRHSGRRLSTLAWVLIIGALWAGFGLWAVRIGDTLGSDVVAVAPSNVPRATAAPAIVTDYTPTGTEDPTILCAELSPQATVVTVETGTGAVLSTLHCSGG